MPAVKQAQEKYGKDGFVVLGFNSDQAVEKMMEYIGGENNYHWPHWFMGKSRHVAQQRHWVTGYPTNFLIGRDGRIISRVVRVNHMDWASLVEEALAPKSLPGK